MAKRQFHWSTVNDCVMHETDGSGATTVEYTHEPGQFGPLISETWGGTIYTRHSDAVGTTTMLTDDTGAVTDRFLFDAWGNCVFHEWMSPPPDAERERGGCQVDPPIPGAAKKEYRDLKFHTAILQPNGQVFAKESRNTAEIRTNVVSEQMMADFRQVLKENLGNDPVTQGKFLSEFGKRHLILEWQQMDPLSAMSKFWVGGQVVAASFYLHGFVPEIDEAVLEATEALFARWFNGVEIAKDACRGLRSIHERPVVIVMPAGKSVLQPEDWHIIGNLCPCLAAVFFDRAEAAIQQIDQFFHQMGYRKGGKETDFVWN